MAKVEIRKHSWLNFADLLEIDGTVFWDTPNFPEITPQNEDRFITITSANLGNLDTIAYQQYGDPDLWWVIALANNLDLWPTDMILNSKLRIPSKSFVNGLFTKGPQR